MGKLRQLSPELWPLIDIILFSYIELIFRGGVSCLPAALLFFHLISSASMSARVFKYSIHNEDNQGSEIYFCLLFPFFPFFYLSLQCNEYGNFHQRFLRNYLT